MELKSEILRQIRNTFRRLDYARWKYPRPGITPYYYKVEIISNACTETRNTLVETGTNYGDMIRNQRHIYKNIYSIESNQLLYERAIKEFGAYPNVHLFQGDSGSKLSEVLQYLNSPCVFWLDAHPAEDHDGSTVPIIEELHTILANPVNGHMIIVDDVRMFTGNHGWPNISTLLELLVKSDRISDLAITYDILNVTLK